GKTTGRMLRHFSQDLKKEVSSYQREVLDFPFDLPLNRFHSRDLHEVELSRAIAFPIVEQMDYAGLGCLFMTTEILAIPFASGLDKLCRTADAGKALPRPICSVR